MRKDQIHQTVNELLSNEGERRIAYQELDGRSPSRVRVAPICSVCGNKTARASI